MTDAELIARLRELDGWVMLGAHTHLAAADRIEQLAATNEALVKERDEAIRRRDAWKSKAEGYDAVRKALREKVGAPWPPNLSRALWAGIAADEKKRADDADAKLAKAADMMLSLIAMIQHAIGPGKDVFIEPDTRRKLSDARATLAEIKGESHE